MLCRLARVAGTNDFGFPQVQLINDQIARQWAEASLKPSAQATDGEWCRRLFLDVIGRIPSVAELREFVAQRDVDKKRQLVDRLLGDERYSNEFARNWTTIWTNILIGRSGGTDRNSITSRAGNAEVPARLVCSQQAVRSPGL